MSGFGVINIWLIGSRFLVHGSHFPLPKKKSNANYFYFLKNLAHCDRICQTVIL